MIRVAIGLAVLVWASSAWADVLYSPEGNRLHRYDIESLKNPPLRQDVFIEAADDDPQHGRNINGMICTVPDGTNRFISGEDTGQPVIKPGWGVFDPDGTQVGKLTATYFLPQGDPFGCAFDSQGRLFTTEIGNSANGEPNGQLIIGYHPFYGPPKVQVALLSERITYLTEHFSWRAVFLINVPLGLLAAGLSLRVPHAPMPRRAGPFRPDAVGAR
jgi:ribosomal protein S15P/S13E